MSLRIAQEVVVCLLDLDGVITNTSRIHSMLWKNTLDSCTLDLLADSRRAVPFQIDSDYQKYMNGRPRLDGIRAFLASRDLDLPLGEPSDLPGWGSLNGIANEKQHRFATHIKAEGVQIFPGSSRFLQETSNVGLRCGVVSSSTMARFILEYSGLGEFFAVVVDGEDIRSLGIPGKPDPSPFLLAARRLDVSPEQVAVFEDSTFGVEAGKQGGFLEVIGVNRDGIESELYQSGASRVVLDLADLID